MNLDKLKGHIPDAVLAQIPDTAAKYGITTPLRLAHFLAQCGHESAGFKAVNENLNYGAKGLLTTFKKYFPTEALAEQYARQPEKIAARVYGSRMGNGDEASKEGWKYRGRGYIQLTGKDNYKAFRQFVPDDVVANPELVADKYPLLSAAWVWSNRNLNRKADTGSTSNAVVLVTRAVNGGTNGLEERQSYFTKYYSLA